MKYLSHGNVYKNFLTMAIPLVVSGLLSQAFNMIDTVMVGQFMGENAIAALGATSPMLTLFSSCFWGLGTGSALYVATLYGSGKFKNLVNTIKLTSWAYILIAALLTAVCIIFANPLFSFLKVDTAIYADARIYFTIYMLAHPFIIVNACFGYVSHSFGDSMTPLILSVAASILNITGNFLFLYFTPFGVAGVAVATLVSSVIKTAVYIAKFTKIFNGFNCKKQKLYFDKEEIGECLRYGIPCCIQQMAMYLSSFAVSPMVNALGSSATAGYTVGMKIYSITSGIYQNSSKCLSNYSAQCMGAKKYDKIGLGVRAGFIQACLLLLPVSVIFMMYPERIAAVFFRSGNGTQSIEIACMFMKYCLPFILLGIINNLFHSLFKGVKAMKSVIVSTASYTAVRIAASILLAPQYGMKGIYMALTLSWLAEAIVICGIYFSGRWRSVEMLSAKK